MGAIARLATGRRSKWVVIAIWLAATLAAIPLQSKLQTLASDESGAFQDRDAESTRIDDLIDRRFPSGGETTALVLYTRSRGQLTPQDAERVASDASALCNKGQIPDVVRVITPVQIGCGDLPPLSPPQSSTIKSASEDLSTQFTTVWTRDDATDVVARDVAAMREIVPGLDARGLRTYVTGEAGFA